MVTPLRCVASPSGAAGVDDAAIRLDAIYRQYWPMVQTVCRRMLRDPELAADVAQETFVSALRSISGLRSEDPIGPWLTTIAKRRCFDQLRRIARQVPECTVGPDIERNAMEDVIARVEDAIDASAAVKALEPALKRLTRRQHRAVQRFAEGWTHQQIAEELNVQIVAARALLHRAREKIRSTALDG